MRKKNTLPGSVAALQQAYTHCEQRGRFKEIDKTAYADYLLRAQKDLSSAERDLHAGDLHWARVKAYQSLFHLLNALFVKHAGYFSKDHGCILVALMTHNIITPEIADRLQLLTAKTIKEAAARKVYQDLDEFRLQRNFALYKPKAWEEIKTEDVAEEIKKIKANFKILLELL